MIEVVGLIHPGNQEQIPFAWALYSNQDPDVAQFKQTFCRKNVDLHFVGVWDTVASVGIFPRKLFLLTDKCDHITHFRHALALDERRVKFIPEHIRYKYDIVTAQEPPGSVNEYKPSSEAVAKTHLLTSSGGGNKTNTTLDRGGEPLKWMMEEAQKAGLSVRLHDVKIGKPRPEVIESLTGGWWILECLIPVSWKTYSSGRSTWTISRWPYHRGRYRQVLPFQRIHWTVNASIGGGVNNNSHIKYTPGVELVAYDGASQPVPQWNSLATSPPTSGLVLYGEGDRDWQQWEGDQNWTQMLKLLKDEPTAGANGENWLLELHEFSQAPGRGPQAIFPYGGPQFLNRLIARYPGDKKAVEIVRRIIGYTDDLKYLSNQPMSLENHGTLDLMSQSSAIEDQISNTVIPRLSLVLRQWASKSQENTNQSDSHPKGTIATAETKGKSYWSRFLVFFKAQPVNEPEISSVDVSWNLNQIPKSSRSIELAKILVDLVTELITIGAARNIPDVAENLTLLMLELLQYPKDYGQLTDEEAGLIEGVLNAMAKLFEYEPAKAVFKSKRVAFAIGPVFESSIAHPGIAVSVARVVAVVAQDVLCNLELRWDDRIFQGLILILKRGKDHVVEPHVMSEAAAALAVLAENFVSETIYRNEFVLTPKPANLKFSETNMDHLAELMEDYPNATLVMANIAKNYRFGEANEKKIGRIAFGLLKCNEERQIQAAARILKEFLNRNIILNQLCQSDVPSVLVVLLKSNLTSQAVIVDILDVVVQLALKGKFCELCWLEIDLRLFRC
ncbi:hypothetical protein FRC09_015915 [Ceratobasidium sp. 395]|nr:hypothetical protein FRC09_015915 [Ceratobasidium sp. 395]